jgi:hypothetical protein
MIKRSGVPPKRWNIQTLHNVETQNLIVCGNIAFTSTVEAAYYDHFGFRAF